MFLEHEGAENEIRYLSVCCFTKRCDDNRENMQCDLKNGIKQKCHLIQGGNQYDFAVYKELSEKVDDDSDVQEWE